MLYSGALEPIDRNDLGEHGYIEGTYDEGKVRTRFVPFASRSYQNLLLTVREGSTQHTLEEMLRNEIMKRGGKNIYRVIIQGTRSPGSLLLAERLKSMGNIVEVLDESRPAYDLEKLHEQYKGTLIGDYIEQFPDNGRRPVVQDKALYHGLQALLNASVLVNGRTWDASYRCSRCLARATRYRWNAAGRTIRQRNRRSATPLTARI